MGLLYKRPVPRTTIAHVLTSLHIGGAERVALLLAKQQLEDGHRVLVITYDEPDGEGVVGDAPLRREFEKAGVPVFPIRKRPGFDPLLTLRTAVMLLRKSATVVHTHNEMPLIYGAPAGRLVRRRVVHTAHGQSKRGPRTMALRRLGGRCVHEYVGVSVATAAFAEEMGEAKRTHVILNATNLKRFRPDEASRAAMRQEWGLAPDARVIGSVGRLAEVKNQQLMLRAAAPLLLDGRCDAMVIAGGGPKREPLEKLAAELGVADKFKLLGEVSNVPEVMTGFDLFTLSSHSEGLPLVLAEAMACGLPVVAPDVGGISKVVDHEKTGYVVPKGDEEALRARYIELLADRDKAHEMGVVGRQIAQERYAVPRQAREYAELYGIL